MLQVCEVAVTQSSSQSQNCFSVTLQTQNIVLFGRYPDKKLRSALVYRYTCSNCIVLTVVKLLGIFSLQLQNIWAFCKSTSHVQANIPHPEHPKSRTSHIPNIPHPEHLKSFKIPHNHIPNIPHAQSCFSVTFQLKTLFYFKDILIKNFAPLSFIVTRVVTTMLLTMVKLLGIFSLERQNIWAFCKSTSHIPNIPSIPHPEHPTCRTSHILNIPHPQHSTSPTSPYPQHSTCSICHFPSTPHSPQPTSRQTNHIACVNWNRRQCLSWNLQA